MISPADISYRKDNNHTQDNNSSHKGPLEAALTFTGEPSAVKKYGSV